MFLTVAGAMTSAFSAIEKNQAWGFRPQMVTELGLCLHMPQRELNIHWSKVNGSIREIIADATKLVLVNKRCITL